jgi:predicted TIM-barrel fold metal-dependent hydrolase
MNYCIEKFGPERCMFESNFPVDKVSYSYNVLFNAFKRLSASYSSSERAALFHDTAVKVYGIDYR